MALGSLVSSGTELQVVQGDRGLSLVPKADRDRALAEPFPAKLQEPPHQPKATSIMSTCTMFWSLYQVLGRGGGLGFAANSLKVLPWTVKAS